MLCTLGLDEARDALAQVLAAGPDLLGLQEWGMSRLALLRDVGRVRLIAPAGVGMWVGARRRSPRYTWIAPLWGECPVGFRPDRLELLGCRSRPIGLGGRVDRGARPGPVVPARLATVAVFRDLGRNRVISLIDFHLTAGVQARGVYRADRPHLGRRHRREVRNLQRLVTEQLELGREVHAVGDSNFDGLRLDGLTSVWDGHEDEPGTLGPRRKVDDVHGLGPADSVKLLTTPSDHKAVVVTRRG